mmetsp:Transcript_56905/g.138557  ORF Transcript_56905/g.138557 Transcript_56905/m.138557 type:complete len:460 (+) Transcript_56905:190-1569(+)
MTMAMVLSSSASEDDHHHHAHVLEMENFVGDSGRCGRRHNGHKHQHHVDGCGGTRGSSSDDVDADLERFKRETDAAICDLVTGLGSCTPSSCIEDPDHGTTQTIVVKNKNTKTTIDGTNDELRKNIDKYRHIKTVPSFDGSSEQHKQQQLFMMMMMIRQEMVRHPLPTVHESSFEDTRSLLSFVQSSSSSSSRDTSFGCCDEENEGSQNTNNDVSVTVSMILNETAGDVDDDDDDDNSSSAAMQQSFEKPPIIPKRTAEMKKIDTTVANNTPATVMAANEVLMTAAKAFVAENHEHKCTGEGSMQEQARLTMKTKGDTNTHLKGDSERASGSIHARDPVLETNDAMIAAVNAFIDKEKPVFEKKNDEIHPKKTEIPAIEIAYKTNGLMNNVEVDVPSKSIDCFETNNNANHESGCTTTLLIEEEDSTVVVNESIEDQILVDDIQQSYCCSSILGVSSCS